MIPCNTIVHNRYKILGEIARGGMGIVYLAEDQVLEGNVALKVSLFSDDKLRAAFEREAKLLASLRHPGLPRVIDHFIEDGTQALVMDYIPGDSLLDRLENPSERDGRGLDASKVIAWADQLLLILRYLHEHAPPIIHRDVKPLNIKLMPSGQLVLLDFGLAKARAATSVIGASMAYAPLEQVNGAGTTPRSDLFSVGATIYHLITGDLPWSCTARLTAVHSGQPDPLLAAHEINDRVKPDVAKVVAWAMSLDAARRPATAEELRAALQYAAKKAGVSSPTPPVKTAVTKHLASGGEVKQNGEEVIPDTDQPALLPTRQIVEVEPVPTATIDPSSAPAGGVTGGWAALAGVARSGSVTPDVPPISAISEPGESPPLAATVPSVPLMITQPALSVVTVESPLTPRPDLIGGIPAPAKTAENPQRKKPRRTSVYVSSIAALFILATATTALWWVAARQSSDSQETGGTPAEASPIPGSTLNISVYQITNKREQVVVPAKHQFRNGDNFRLGVESSRDGVLYLLSKDQSGSVSIIHPDVQNDDGKSTVAASREIRIPPVGGFGFRNTKGTEYVYFIFASNHDDELIRSAERVLGDGSKNISLPAVRDLFDHLDRQAAAIREREGERPSETLPHSMVVAAEREPLVGILKLNEITSR